MPMAAVVDEEVFCVHGGFPREMALPGAPTALEALADLPCPCSISPPMVCTPVALARLRAGRSGEVSGDPP